MRLRPRNAPPTQSDEDRAEYFDLLHRARLRKNLEGPVDEARAVMSHTIGRGPNAQVVIETLDPPWPERRELEPYDDEHELPDEAPPGWP